MCFFFNVFNFEYVLENINLDMKRKKKKKTVNTMFELLWF